MMYIEDCLRYVAHSKNQISLRDGRLKLGWSVHFLAISHRFDSNLLCRRFEIHLKRMGIISILYTNIHVLVRFEGKDERNR